MKVGNACGFWGDDVDAPRRCLEQQPDLDYLTLDYLAEVSLSIMAIQKEKDPTLGYAKDFVAVFESLIPYFEKGGKCKIITNGGGLNPEGLALACQKINPRLKIAVVSGDDVLDQLKKDPEQFNHLDTKESLKNTQLVTANAYMGARPIAVALDLGADVVITGRVADPSLTVGPCLYHYAWAHDAYDQIAGATIAGHLIECGTQVTGGISTDWMTVTDWEDIGYPVAEIFSDGSSIITKIQGTGGRVTERTVKEQLLYEIGDPAAYKSPDAVVSFLGLSVKEEAPNRVRVEGALGSPPPPNLKVSATYRAGYRAVGLLAFFGEDVVNKAKRAGEMVFKKLAKRGFALKKTLIEVIGDQAVVPGLQGNEKLMECQLRLSALDDNKQAIEAFAQEIAPLVTAGPQGTTGYISGRAEVRPVFGFWPCLIPASALRVNIHLIEEK